MWLTKERWRTRKRGKKEEEKQEQDEALNIHQKKYDFTQKVEKEGFEKSQPEGEIGLGLTAKQHLPPTRSGLPQDRYLIC